MTCEFGTAKRIHMNSSWFADCNTSYLGFLKVCDNPNAFWHDIHELGARANVLAFFDTDLAQLTGLRCCDDRIIEIDLCLLHTCLSTFDICVQRGLGATGFGAVLLRGL